MTPTKTEAGELAEQEVVPTGADLKFTAPKYVVQALIEKATAVLPTRDFNPVLKNFQIRVQKSPAQMQIMATDTELSLLAVAKVKVGRSGTAVFPGKSLLEIAKEADDGDIVIDVDKGIAHIHSHRTTWDLHLKDGSQYPRFPDTETLDFQTVDREKFVRCLNLVRKAASRERTRANMMVVSITGDGRFRATDGNRLQQALMGEWPGLNIQIPIGTADTMAKFLRSTSEPKILIADHDQFIAFEIGSDTYIAAKLSSTMPDVDAQLLAPALKNKKRLAVDRAALLNAIRRVRITADSETLAVVMSLTKEEMKVWARDARKNEASETLDVEWSGGDQNVAVNHQHLVEMLEMSDAERCELFLGDGTKTKPSPVLMRDEDLGLLGVLIQIRM